jgi:hypothetical protein
MALIKVNKTTDHVFLMKSSEMSKKQFLEYEATPRKTDHLSKNTKNINRKAPIN